MTKASIEFQVTTSTVKYGEKRKFIEYAIHFVEANKVVGIETGPRRQTVGRTDCLRAARARIRTLRSHKLFAIRVTRKHISDGDARACNTCAISQALWHNQERMGFPRNQFSFEVSSYACFAEARGIVISEKYGGDEIGRIPVDKLPEIAVLGYKSDKVYSEGIPEWTMQWDEWAESRYMDLKEWREKHGYDEGERPSRPCPASFVLDLDEIVSAAEGGKQ